MAEDDASLTGDDFERLVETWRPMVIKFAGAWHVDGLDFDDLTQELLLTLWRAAKQFDPSRGTSFTTYLYNAFRNTMIKLLTRTTRQMRVPRYLLVPIDDDNAASIGEPVEPDLSLPEALATASPDTQNLASLTLDGYDTPEAWRACGVDPAKIRVGVMELRRLLLDEREVTYDGGTGIRRG